MHKNENILLATKNALNGVAELFKERSARKELFLIVIALGFFCYRPNVYTVLIAVLSMVLLAIEALNTALEKTCDFISQEQHPEIKRIKDLGAAAVLIIVLAIALIFIRYLSPFF